MPFRVRLHSRTPNAANHPYYCMSMGKEQESQVTHVGSPSPQPTSMCTPRPKTSAPSPQPTCCPWQRRVQWIIKKVTVAASEWNMIAIQRTGHKAERQVSEHRPL